MLSRRLLLSAGVGAALVASGSLAQWQRSAQDWQRYRQTGLFATEQASVLRAVGDALLDGLLQEAPKPRASELEAQLQRVVVSVQGFPLPLQQELHLLLQLLALKPGARLLAQLHTPWAEARRVEVALCLQKMRMSSWLVRRQAYQALRDLHFAAWAAEPANWKPLGYPGPVA
jgi:hypothetical protein